MIEMLIAIGGTFTLLLIISLLRGHKEEIKNFLIGLTIIAGLIITVILILKFPLQMIGLMLGILLLLKLREE